MLLIRKGCWRAKEQPEHHSGKKAASNWICNRLQKKIASLERDKYSLSWNNCKGSNAELLWAIWAWRAGRTGASLGQWSWGTTGYSQEAHKGKPRSRVAAQSSALPQDAFRRHNPEDAQRRGAAGRRGTAPAGCEHPVQRWEPAAASHHKPLLWPSRTQPRPRDGIHALHWPAPATGMAGRKTPAGLTQKAGGETSGNGPCVGSGGRVHINKRSQEDLVEEIRSPSPLNSGSFQMGNWNETLFLKCSGTFWISLVFISCGSAQKKYINLQLF